MVGAIDQHGVGVWHVQPTLDNECGDENIDLTLNEPPHDGLEVSLLHLPVTDRNPGFRDDLFQFISNAMNGLNPVVNVKDLSGPADFPHHRFTDQFAVKWSKIGSDDLAIGRRGFDYAQIPDAEQ